MKKSIAITLSVLGFIILVGLANSFYIVNEDEVAVVKRLSSIKATVVAEKDAELVRQNLESNGLTNIEVIDSKGLHFKVPFVESVTKYTSKYLTYQSLEELINTNDGRRVKIQMYGQYRIVDPIVFIQSVEFLTQANQRMDDEIYKTVINVANTLEFNEFFYQTTLEDKLDSRQEILNEKLLANFGLYVSDIGINRKSFPDANIANIEEKMAKEIGKESEKLVAEGDAVYTEEAAKTDRQKTEIISAAIEEAATIMAEADAEALRIYQEALQKDLEFYQFTQRMKIYSELEDVTIFLNADNSIFDYIDGYETNESTSTNTSEPEVVEEAPVDGE